MYFPNSNLLIQVVPTSNIFYTVKSTFLLSWHEFYFHLLNRIHNFLLNRSGFKQINTAVSIFYVVSILLCICSLLIFSVLPFYVWSFTGCTHLQVDRKSLPEAHQPLLPLFVHRSRRLNHEGTADYNPVYCAHGMTGSGLAVPGAGGNVLWPKSEVSVKLLGTVISTLRKGVEWKTHLGRQVKLAHVISLGTVQTSQVYKNHEVMACWRNGNRSVRPGSSMLFFCWGWGKEYTRLQSEDVYRRTREKELCIYTEGNYHSNSSTIKDHYLLWLNGHFPRTSQTELLPLSFVSFLCLCLPLFTFLWDIP